MDKQPQKADSLNDLPKHIVAQAREIKSNVKRHIFLRRYVKPADLRYLNPFIEQVIVSQNDDIENWRRDPWLTMRYEDSQLLGLSVAEATKPLSPYDEHGSFRIKPTLKRWQLGMCGAPVRRGQGLTYRSNIVSPLTSLASSFSNSIEDVAPENVHEFNARWYTCIIAKGLWSQAYHGRLSLDSGRVARDYLALLSPERTQVICEDFYRFMELAIEELRSIGNNDAIPGYTGPARLYAL